MFCFKEHPFGLCGVSLKVIFYCFALNHTLLHVSCILLVSKFNTNIQINWLMSIFQGIILNNAKFGQNPKSIFLQYDVLLRTPSLLFRAYLVHFVRQFLCFQTKCLVLVIKGLFDQVFHSILIQNYSNTSRSKTFYNVYSISHGFCS